MPEVAEGMGCNVSSKGHIVLKVAQIKIKGNLPTYSTMQFKIKQKTNQCIHTEFEVNQQTNIDTKQD
jgi:hypothetical protein